MSYDIRIWSINKTRIPESLPSDENWKVEEGSARVSAKDWQIVVNESAKLEEEDIDEEISPLLPGISYVTELNLEPIYAPELAKKLLLNTAKNIAKDVIGIIEDPQEDALIAPSGVKRFMNPTRDKDERFSVLEMSWWFGDNPLTKEKILLKLIDYFESKLPEALPRRYGEYEPPQYKYTEEGKPYLKKYLSDHTYDSIVWYPTKPVVNLGYGFLKDWGFVQYGKKKKFRANHLSIEFDANVLSQPGWQKQLRKVFNDISILLKPFYGEVRTLRNNIHRGGTYATDMESEKNPTSSWWWMGIPQKLGQAAVIGDPYLSLLPGFKEKGELIGSLCFLSTDDWSQNRNLNSIIGKTPKELAQVKNPKWVLQKTFTWPWEGRLIGYRYDWNEEFPSLFPF